MSGRRDAVLREMGLAPLWRLRIRAEAETDPTAEGPGVPAPESGASVRVERSDAAPRPLAAFMSASLADVSEAPRQATPRSEAKDLREVEATRPDAPVSRDSAAAPRLQDPSGMDWETLEAEIRRCTSCGLCERRKQAVPGVGDRLADWMLVGEGPGAEEDRLGEPFVGAAGKLLDAMLASIGLARGEGVYIANAVKCRPPHNRTPEPREIEACFPFLARQIELVRPKLLVALGRPAAQALLKSEIGIGASRGKVLRYGSIPVVVTYHPAYLLRNPQDKAKVWEDLCFARRLMRDMAAPG